MNEKVECISCSKIHLYSKSHDCIACRGDIIDDCEDKYESSCKECLMWMNLCTDKQTGRVDWQKFYAFLY